MKDKPIFDDLHRRIIEIIRKNEAPRAEVAMRFAVSLAFVEKLWRRFRTKPAFIEHCRPVVKKT